MKKSNALLLSTPYILWMVVFTLIPLGVVGYYALTDPQTGAFSLENVKDLSLYMPVLWQSILYSLVSAFICLFPDVVFGIFTSDAAVLAIGPGYVPIAVLLFFGSSMRAIMNALMNGSGNYKVNFATAILDGIVMRIGMALLFGLALDMRHYGFWLGDAVAGFTPFFIGLVFYLTGSWKKGVMKTKNS